MPALIRPLTLALLLTLPGLAAGAELPEFTIAIENHRFIPVETRVPAHTKFRLIVDNRDPTAEEFESYDFNREKVVPGNGRITVYVGPLRPGRYRFFGEFHPESAQGALLAE